MWPVLADAVDVARRALVELEPSGVGVHLGVTAEGDSAATHRFEATLPGYRGWQWAVVVAAAPGAGYATVSESALLPGPDALVAPDFVPWDQRVRPGDLAPGDLLAPAPGDPRLVPGYVATGDPVVDEVALEVGLGRTQVLSLEGREEASERWYSEFGPDTDMAKAAPSTCGLCGFYLPLAGSLRAAFGVCGNALGADGRVVHVEYGCGAHSDTVAPTGAGSPLCEAYDDAAFDVIAPEASRKTESNSESRADSSGTDADPDTPESGSSVEVNGAAAGSSSDTTAESNSAAEPATAAGVVDVPVEVNDGTVVRGDAEAGPGADPASDRSAESVLDRESSESDDVASGSAVDARQAQVEVAGGVATDEPVASAEAVVSGPSADEIASQPKSSVESPSTAGQALAVESAQNPEDAPQGRSADDTAPVASAEVAPDAVRSPKVDAVDEAIERVRPEPESSAQS